MFNDSDSLTGELFPFQEQPKNGQSPNDDDSLNEKYKKGEMRIVTEQGRIDLQSISNIIDRKKYILNPDYQRRKRWNNRRKSRLIESFIMNVPIPPIFLYEIDYALYEVMDGLQRLTAIDEFYKGKFALEGLEYWKELNGKKYQNLPSNVRAGIDRRHLSSVILLAETANSKESAEFLKKVVFGRLNSGGEKLTPQELRNALYNGKLNQLCLKLAKNDIFRKLWHFPLEHEVDDLLLKSEDELETEGRYTSIVMDKYRRMDDVELVLRFFAYNQINQIKQLKENTPDRSKSFTIEGFLDEYLEIGNRFSDEELAQLETTFIETITLIYNIFNNKAFVAPRRQLQSNTPTKMIYDPLMKAFSQHIDYKEQLLKQKFEIFTDIYKNKKSLKRSTKNNQIFDSNYMFEGNYMFDGGQQTVRDVEVRINYYNQFLQKYIV